MGKTVLVTGSSRGIGLALCHELHSKGYQVIATCRNLDDIKSEPFYKKLALEVAEDASIAALSKELAGEPIDLLINNAGIISPGQDSVHTLTREGLLGDYAVDAVSPLMVTQGLLANLTACRGSVLNISTLLASIAMVEPSFSFGAMYSYRAAKAGLNMANKVLALEAQAELGWVVAVHPGSVKTDMNARGDVSVEDAARHIVASMEKLTPAQSGSFIDLYGAVLPW